jgi:hypothetical protein
MSLVNQYAALHELKITLGRSEELVSTVYGTESLGLINWQGMLDEITEQFDNLIDLIEDDLEEDDTYDDDAPSIRD